MAKFNLRFAITRPDGARSSIWHVRRHGSQVYVIFDGLGGVQKFSFHTPNLCRLAQTKEHAALMGTERYCLHEWWRDSTPESGSGKRVRVLLLSCGTNVLSTAFPVSKKSFHAIAAAPVDQSTLVELCFTRENESSVLDSLRKSEPHFNHQLLAYEKLDNGEAIVISSYWGDVANDTLDMPAPKESGKSRFGHLVVSPEDPAKTGRPIRVTTFSNPKDGDFIQVWEFGAYQVQDKF